MPTRDPAKRRLANQRYYQRSKGRRQNNRAPGVEMIGPEFFE